jgi:hypothetical protein
MMNREFFATIFVTIKAENMGFILTGPKVKLLIIKRNALFSRDGYQIENLPS